MYDLFRKANDFLFTTLIANKKVYLFIVVFFVYLLNPYWYASHDTVGAQLLPISIIKEFDFDLDEFKSMEFGIPLDEINTVMINGRLVSRYPVLSAVLATSFYLPFVLLGYPVESNPATPAKFYSVSVVTLSVVFLYLAFKEITDDKKALYCSLIYAFATCTWSVSSQDLWQHGASQMFLTASLYFLLRGLREERFVAYSGFALACAVASRPPNLLIAFILLVYVLREHRKVFNKFVLWALPPVLFLLSYSWVYFGSFLMLGQGQNPFEGWSTPLLYGLAGLFISPSKGLFVYSPVLVLSFVGIYLVWKGKNNILLKYFSISIFAMILLWSKWWAWHGGGSYGYRMLVDLTPLLCLFLVPAFRNYYNRKWFKLLLTLLVVYSVVVQIVGVFFFDDSWYKAHIGCYYTDYYGCFWSIGDSQLLYYMKKTFNMFASLST